MIEYIVYFIDEEGDPEEWAASSYSMTEGNRCRHLGYLTDEET